eukprot:6157265-Pyramimonas_sp.AAC.3
MLNRDPLTSPIRLVWMEERSKFWFGPSRLEAQARMYFPLRVTRVQHGQHGQYLGRHPARAS